MVFDPDLATEAPAERQHAVAEFLALLVVHELVGELVLEGAEAPERGAAALGAENAHCENMLAHLAPDLVVGAAAGLGGIVHAVDALAGAAGDQVDVRAAALYVSSALVVERQRAKFAGGWVRECAILSGVHSLSSKPFCGPGPGGCILAGPFRFAPSIIRVMSANVKTFLDI
jgi:hypothetical protein